jgi:hypothetical protein
MTKPCYDVGYGKPPPHTRFQKGQSGNPKGRSKGTKNFAAIFMTAMRQSSRSKLLDSMAFKIFDRFNLKSSRSTRVRTEA